MNNLEKIRKENPDQKSLSVNVVLSTLLINFKKSDLS